MTFPTCRFHLNVKPPSHHIDSRVIITRREPVTTPDQPPTLTNAIVPRIIALGRDTSPLTLEHALTPIPMNIVVGGYIVGYPLAGMSWHHLNYLLGLRSLGHQVTFLEDGAFLPPFDPSTGNAGDPTYGIHHLLRSFQALDLNIPWHYRFGNLSFGLSIDDMQATLRHADLFIAVSGITPTAWYDLPRRTLVIDTDPVYTQVRLTQDTAFLDYYRSFTHRATFGRLIGTPRSRLPTADLDWIPSQQPIALEHWPVTPLSPQGRFTTLGKWDHSADRIIEFMGRQIPSSKSREYETLIDLPSNTGAPLELCMASMPNDDAARYQHHGWSIGDPTTPSASVEAYRTYIQNSLGEFTVVKTLYAAEPSGWFSDRSAAFLASGRPVVTQRSGFEHWLPTGEGLFAFSNPIEAAEALRLILKDPNHHARAARKIAEEHFDARTVLRDLLLRV